MCRIPMSLLVAAAALLAVRPALALTINILPDVSLSGNPAALAAFQRAANAWSTHFNDPVNINIRAALSSTFSDSSVIGVTRPITNHVSYDSVRNAMVKDAANDPNDAIVALLPTSATITANVPPGDTFVPTSLSISRANEKAIGLIASDSASDATMVFNSNYPFDYDSSDGVDPDEIDFQTVVTHEIGHTLGFSSNVDSFDGGFATTDLSTLDLFRFSGTAPVNALTFATGPREMRPGQASVFSDTSTAYAMSTGVDQGDGLQASHWKDDDLTGEFIGVMDPSLAFGVAEPITAADVRALDLIGYDAVPEPASLGLIALGLVTLRRCRA